MSMGLMYTVLIIIFSGNISAIKSYAFSIRCLQSELVMPDMQMNHSFDLIVQTDL